MAWRGEHVEAILEQIQTAGVSATAKLLPCVLPAQDDEAFLEVGDAVQVDCLVAGNPVAAIPLLNVLFVHACFSLLVGLRPIVDGYVVGGRCWASARYAGH
jgi:hypothetical protein